MLTLDAGVCHVAVVSVLTMRARDHDQCRSAQQFNLVELSCVPCPSDLFHAVFTTTIYAMRARGVPTGEFGAVSGSY